MAVQYGSILEAERDRTQAIVLHQNVPSQKAQSLSPGQDKCSNSLRAMLYCMAHLSIVISLKSSRSFAPILPKPPGYSDTKPSKDLLNVHCSSADSFSLGDSNNVGQ